MCKDKGKSFEKICCMACDPPQWRCNLHPSGKQIAIDVQLKAAGWCGVGSANFSSRFPLEDRAR